MKNLVVVIFFLAGLSLNIWAQGDGKANIVFEKNTFDFGDIKQGEKVNVSFKFKNTGKEPLIIGKVLTTCGCTVPTYPKEPIKPGASGKIDAVFNSAGKMGRQNKVINVLSNAANNDVQLILSGNVLRANSIAAQEPEPERKRKSSDEKKKNEDEDDEQVIGAEPGDSK